MIALIVAFAALDIVGIVIFALCIKECKDIDKKLNDWSKEMQEDIEWSDR